MKRQALILGLVAWSLCAGPVFADAAPVIPPADIQQIERIVGFSGTLQDGVFVVRMPRADLAMTIHGEPAPTALGFVNWVAWIPVDGRYMIMGDFVLLEDEINPVLSALDAAGIQATALHNHFLWESPRVLFIHIHGMGTAAALAQGVRAALEHTATPLSPAPGGPAASLPLSLDSAALEKILGCAGKEGGGVLKFTVGRAGVVEDGIPLTAPMGLNSWAAFYGSPDQAHVAGDVAMTASEVPRVIQVLRAGDIAVVSVHSHMLNETPRIFFLHYWGTGCADQLAQTIRAVLDIVSLPAR